MQFSHLHNHSQYSLLDGAINIKKMFDKAEKDGMPAIALTDHGNMFGAFHFVSEAWNRKGADGQPKVKPIVGCEFYMVEDRHKRSFTGGEKDVRYHQLLLAKNEIGYKNLVKLTSLGFIEGLYSKFPRIDKKLLEQYHEGLIATSCCIGAEIPKTILEKGEEAAEEKLKWWLDMFGDDYFLEIQRHGMPQEDKVNDTILRFSEKYNIPVIATNDSHYLDREDYNAHDILLCVNTGEKQATPVIKDFVDSDSVNKKDYRFGFFNDEFFVKTQKEMRDLFRDLPHTIDNTQMVVDKIDVLNLKKDILLPNFPLPSGFINQDSYLRHLTMEGARTRYHEMTAELEERLNFELQVIENMGFAGYFLIVSDFIKAGKDMGVFIGPGRGSAAGSAVAFCIGITNIDPIKYNLLFERFLNPDRKSMPDIDTDFDDEGRQKVINYVVEKYTYNQVAHIVTYGTMAAKSSIKDVARVLDLPLAQSNKLAKLVPDIPGTSLQDVLHMDLQDPKMESYNKEDIQEIRKYYNSISLESDVLHEAEKLEGSIRNTGLHAAGIIIAPEDLTSLIPVCTNKDTNLLITQYDGSIIENAGVIKMDFLGLRTLSILKDAIEIIQRVYGQEIILDDLPLDDELTYQIYQNGHTNGIFQFESPGMQKYLKELKPDKLDDIIAMNALYRPGPMVYIPSFINRKKGIEQVTYDLEGMEEFLEETYGITVYQEQVMLLSQKIANFSKGDADVLRKAMGKKLLDVLDNMKDKFMEGGISNNHPKDKLEKVWNDWSEFAKYAFNKSHSTCYSILSYQTAYLKAHYPAAFMAALLNHAGSAEKIAFLLKECKRMNIEVLGPDVNESRSKFTVTSDGIIRFGFNGMKGLGDSAVESILEERDARGTFKDIYDFIERVNLRTVNKKSMESMAMGGAFDNLGEWHRKQYVGNDDGSSSGIEILIKYGKSRQLGEGENTINLFGDASEDTNNRPALPKLEPWSDWERLHKEKEVVGLYLSGHPLERYEFEFANYHVNPMLDVHQAIRELDDIWSEKRFSFDDEKEFKNAAEKVKQNMRVIGMVQECARLQTKKGDPYIRFRLADFDSELTLALFRDEYYNFHHLVVNGHTLMIDLQLVQDWRTPGVFQTKIVRITPIENVRQLFTKKVALQVRLEDLDDKLLNVLMHAFSTDKKDQTDLSITISDESSSEVLAMKTYAGGVEMNDEFSEFLVNESGIKFKIYSN